MDSNTNDLLRNIGISAVSALPVCGITIPESTINNWKKLSSESRTQLRMLMRKHSFVNWYYKANNKKAEEIYYIINEDYANEEEDDMNEMI